jgi:hypothetical protein
VKVRGDGAVKVSRAQFPPRRKLAISTHSEISTLLRGGNELEDNNHRAHNPFHNASSSRLYSALFVGAVEAPITGKAFEKSNRPFPAFVQDHSHKPALGYWHHGSVPLPQAAVIIRHTWPLVLRHWCSVCHQGTYAELILE